LVVSPVFACGRRLGDGHIVDLAGAPVHR
jgi:hypothetical protein